MQFTWQDQQVMFPVIPDSNMEEISLKQLKRLQATNFIWIQPSANSNTDISSKF